MGDILMSMGILPTRTSDVEAFTRPARLDPFLKGYVSQLADADAVPDRARRPGVHRGAAEARSRRLQFGQTRRRGCAKRPPSPTRPRSSTQRPRANQAVRPDVAATTDDDHRRLRHGARHDTHSARDRRSPCWRRAVGADRRLRPPADALTIWLSFQDWSTQTPFATASSSALDNFRDMFGNDLGRARLQGSASRNTAVYTALSVALILPLSVALRPADPPRRCPAAAACCAGMLFSTYMVPMIAVALVWSKLYSPTEGPLNQMLGWSASRPSRGCRRRTPRCARSSSSTSGSRSATSPCWWSPA